jgi:hypothetical protein
MPSRGFSDSPSLKVFLADATVTFGKWLIACHEAVSRHAPFRGFEFLGDLIKKF